MHWMFLPLRRFARLRGRATRREFWLFHLLLYGLIIAEAVVAAALQPAPTREPPPLLNAVIGFTFLAMLVPMFTVSIRRLHDHDKSGWFLLISLFPLFGWIFWLLMMLTPGTPGSNSYGDNPRDRQSPQVAGVFD